MSISEVINKQAIAMDLDTTDKESTLKALCHLLYIAGSINSIEGFLQDVYRREQEGKTGIGNGIAIPHGKSDAVKQTCIAIAKLKKPITWETNDGKPVQMIMLFAVKNEDRNNYFLKLMAQIARRLANDDFCKEVIASADADELLAKFS